MNIGRIRPVTYYLRYLVYIEIAIKNNGLNYFFNKLKIGIITVLIKYM